MTRKDFEWIAETLRDTRPNYGTEAAYGQWLVVVQHFVTALSNTNSRFDAQRFIAWTKKETI